MRKHSDKEFNKYLKVLAAYGWTVEYSRSHFKVRSPSGRIVSCSLTPSCPHAIKHFKKDVAGVAKQGELP